MQHLLSICVLLFMSQAYADCRDKVVILIPGFFNFPGFEHEQRSIKYFSDNIIETIEKKGRKAVVFENLDPLGTVETNSTQVEANIIALSKTYPTCQFDVIGHSAGGLYLARALTKNPNLPVKTVVTISTPYQGAEIVNFAGKVPGWETVTSFLSLGSLAEFEPKKMDQVLAKLVVPEQIRWVAVAAEQKPCLLLSCARAERLTWVLTLAWEFFGQAGDGVVSVDSALIKNKSFMGSNGKPKMIERWQDLTVPLEHWEIVLDSYVFSAIGVTNTDWIALKQRETFQAIIDRL